jgi:hypothetical protein
MYIIYDLQILFELILPLMSASYYSKSQNALNYTSFLEWSLAIFLKKDGRILFKYSQ